MCKHVGGGMAMMMAKPLQHTPVEKRLIAVIAGAIRRGRPVVFMLDVDKTIVDAIPVRHDWLEITFEASRAFHALSQLPCVEVNWSSARPMDHFPGDVGRGIGLFCSNGAQVSYRGQLLQHREVNEAAKDAALKNLWKQVMAAARSSNTDLAFYPSKAYDRSTYGTPTFYVELLPTGIVISAAQAKAKLPPGNTTAREHLNKLVKTLLKQNAPGSKPFHGFAMSEGSGGVRFDWPYRINGWLLNKGLNNRRFIQAGALVVAAGDDWGDLSAALASHIFYAVGDDAPGALRDIAVKKGGGLFSSPGEFMNFSVKSQ